MSFSNIAISLKSSRIKATLLAKGISCGNRRFLSSNCGATYYGPFRASRGANRDSASSHPALRNPLNYHLESRVVRDLRNRTSRSEERIGYNCGGSGGRSRRNIYVREPSTREHLEVGHIYSLSAKFMARVKKTNNVG